MAEKNSKDLALVELDESTNPWLEVREPLPDKKYEERNLREANMWLGAIAVQNNDALTQLSETVKVFDYLNSQNAFILGFGRQIKEHEGCQCDREHLHTHFILRVRDKVRRETAYKMACTALQELQLQPLDHYKAFSYLASVYKMELLLGTNMLCRHRGENNRLAQTLQKAQLDAYADVNLDSS